MAKLIILVGLPASGKSTWAESYITENENVVVVSTDAIRGELFGEPALQYEENAIKKRLERFLEEIPKKRNADMESVKRHMGNMMVFGRANYEIRKNLSNGRTVVFDATNVRANNRMNMLKKMHGLYDQAEALSICLFFFMYAMFVNHTDSFP